MDFLIQQNKEVNGEDITEEKISAKNKKVIIIGGGDTGSDCVGTSVRQNAESVIQIEIMPKPPEARSCGTPWPDWPYKLRTSSSQKEGCERLWNIMTKSFEGKNGKLKKINMVKVEWEMSKDGLPVSMKEIPGSEFSLNVDIIFLSMGFTGPEKISLLEQFNAVYDERGNLSVDEKGSIGNEKIFAAGDIVSGPSLVVRALEAGKQAAEDIDEYLSINIRDCHKSLLL